MLQTPGKPKENIKYLRKSFASANANGSCEKRGWYEKPSACVGELHMFSKKIPKKAVTALGKREI